MKYSFHKLILMVCNTWRDLTEGAVNDPYFKHETMFSLANVKASITNSEPHLTVPDVIYMSEDAGTIQYQLEATDDEGDTIEFYLDGSYTNYTMGTPILSVDGILLFTPCEDCMGIQTFPVILQEVQTDPVIPPNNVTVWLTVNVTDVADPPTIFLTLLGDSQLPSDPTEPVLVYLEQKNDWNEHIWSPSWYGLLGAYDVEIGGTLQLNVQEPVGGVMNITDNSTSIPTIANPCPNVTKRTDDLMFPCDLSLLKPVNEHEWNYMTLTYIQNYSFSGYDEAKVYFSDVNGALSRLVTIQFTVMESPCRNEGECEPKNNSISYPCEHYRRASESFDINYNCICASGWTGIHCEEDINECISSPCPDPFICYDYLNRYECACPQDNPICLFLLPWMIALILIGVLLIVGIVLLIVYRWKRRESHIPWIEKYILCQSEDTTNSCGFQASLADFMDDSDLMSADNPSFDFNNPDKMEFPPRGDLNIEKRHKMSSFDPLIASSGPKIAPHPFEVVDSNLSADLNAMSNNGTKPESSGSGTSTPQEKAKKVVQWAPSVSSGSPVPSGQNTPPSNRSEDGRSSGSKSPYRVSDSQTSTADPGKISLYDGTMTPIL
ncbi:uncharacterized protein LOC127711916 [Mytilus californianus]|uniref:uncharacterized protein LOC127711916 n=1 Tax=Mytilus californianus TaxID=6549 RepID=UPI002247BC24|nr:uncharacterized protein LOC127711916 [Mytilus californianus]